MNPTTSFRERRRAGEFGGNKKWGGRHLRYLASSPKVPELPLYLSVFSAGKENKERSIHKRGYCRALHTGRLRPELVLLDFDGGAAFFKAHHAAARH